jgi:flagellin
MKNLHQLNENLESSISRITDLDIAEETTKMVKDKILSESSVISLNKANDLPKNHIKALLDIK